MLSLQLFVFCVLFQFFSILSPRCSCARDDSTISFPELETEEELTKLQATQSCLATLFNVKGVPNHLMESLYSIHKLLKGYGIEIVMFSCAGQNISICPNETTVRLSRYGELYEYFPPEFLHGKSAIISHFLMYRLAGDVPYVDDEEEWQTVLNNAKGKDDVILFYAKAFGSTAHRHFMETIWMLLPNYQFVITTSASVSGFSSIQDLGPNEEESIWYNKCGGVNDATQACPVIKSQGPLKRLTDVLRFIVGQKYPNVSTISEDGSSQFDGGINITIPMSVNYIFVSTSQFDEMVALANSLVLQTKHFVNFVLVDKDKHPAVVQKFGVLEKTNFPTLVSELRNFDKSGKIYVEQWEYSALFSERSILDFINALHQNPTAFFRDRAVRYGPRSLPARSQDDKRIPIGSIVAGCSDDEDACKDFNIHLRRAVRTLFHYGYQHVIIDYWDFTGSREQNLETQFPAIGYQSTEEDFVKFKEEEMTYENILNFITQSLGIDNIKPIPLSGSDTIPIGIQTSEAGTFASMQTDEGESNDDEDSDIDDAEEGNAEMLAMEEDEVAKDFVADRLNASLGFVQKRMHTKALDAKTFQEGLKHFEVVVIHFYLPWDSRSYRLHKAYDAMAKTIAEDNLGKENKTLIADVSCHDWPDVCSAANVTFYPTIKVYRNGVHWRVYNGILGKEDLLRAVRLYQLPHSIKLLSNEEVTQFKEGNTPTPAAETCPVSVLAIVKSDTSQEFNIFSSVAKEFSGVALFGYAVGELGALSAKEMGLEIPSIVVFHREDPYRTVRISSAFHFENLTMFIRGSLTPSFGELTAYNFPNYQRQAKPYVILFKKGNEQTAFLQPLIDLTQTQIIDRVSLTWMNEENNVTKSIKQAYVGEVEGPVVVLVNHNKGTIHPYPRERSDLPLRQWLEQCLDGLINPEASLRTGKWTPLREGFDYLKLEEQLKRKGRNQRGLPKNLPEYPPRKRSRYPPQKEAPVPHSHHHDEL